MYGYTVDQLANYIKRQLGFPTWQVELSHQQILDKVQDALFKFSQYRPKLGYQALPLARNVNAYLKGVEIGQDGPIQVDFVEPLPTPTAIFYGNLIDPAPLFRTGLDEYDTWMRWRKTWMRVTSVQPDWYYDQVGKVLYIHNPIERYSASVFAYLTYNDTTELTQVGAEWVKEYSLETCRWLYGDIMSKYSGAIPGPLQNLQLDQQKRSNAEKRIEQLEQKLHGMQQLSPIMID